MLRWKPFVAGFVLWTIYGVLCAWLSHYLRSFGKSPFTWRHAFYLNLSWAYILGALSIGVVWVASRFRLERPKLFLNIAVLVAFNGVYALGASTLMQLVYWSNEPSWTTRFFEEFLFRFNYQLQDTVPLYWAVVFLFYAVDYYRRYQRGLVEAAQLNSQLVRSQLQALKMELHPHFLFNSLNAISELIHEDRGAAERMVIGLGQLLRLSLDTSSEVEVPLHQELRFAQLYLDIEKMRFDERLQITFDIDPDIRDALVPNLLLQPLVENSIKHGIVPRREPGQITLSAKRQSGYLILTVTDNGGGSADDHSREASPREGIGLRTTRERLQKLYGSDQSLQFIRQPGRGAQASIRVPFRIVPREAAHELATSVNC